MRRAAKVDANQPEIVEVFRKAGAQVALTHQLKNLCDCFVAYQRITVAVEIKDGSKPPSAQKLTEGEAEFKERWEMQGLYSVVRDADEALALLANISEAARYLSLVEAQ